MGSPKTTSSACFFKKILMMMMRGCGKEDYAKSQGYRRRRVVDIFMGYCRTSRSLSIVRQVGKVRRTAIHRRRLVT
jgi:hypothetical protein